MKWALDGDVLTLPRALKVINELKSKLNWCFHYFSSPYAPRSWQSKCSMTVFYYCIYTGSTMWRETNSFQKFTVHCKSVFIVTWSLCPCPTVLHKVSVGASALTCGSLQYWSWENNPILHVLQCWRATRCRIFSIFVWFRFLLCFTQYIGFFCSRLFNHPAYFSKNLKHQMIIVHVMLLSCTLVHFSALHLYFHF